MLPVYKWWQVPYYWVGVKAYDFVAGSQLLKPSYLLSYSKALEQFPMLNRDKLKAALVYYDGMHDDTRMAISLALTAIRNGAYCLNYTKCEELLKTCENGVERICGAKVKNTLTGEEYLIKAKCVINATGPYTDCIRCMGDETIKKICQPSSGVQIVLPDYYSPETMGLLDPSTSDGRVIFFLPWQNVTVVDDQNVNNNGLKFSEILATLRGKKRKEKKEKEEEEKKEEQKQKRKKKASKSEISLEEGTSTKILINSVTAKTIIVCKHLNLTTKDISATPRSEN